MKNKKAILHDQIMHCAKMGYPVSQTAVKIGKSESGVRQFARKNHLQFAKELQYSDIRGLTDEMICERCRELARELGISNPVTVWREETA